LRCVNEEIGNLLSQCADITQVRKRIKKMEVEKKTTSEATGNLRIFYKDKNNEFKGPFTERQVQERYRKKWFESSFPFYFMKSDDSPDDSTPSFTLEELIKCNGIGAPFRLPSEVVPRGKARTQSEQKLNSIEEEIRFIRVKYEVITVDHRIEDLEEQIKLREELKKKEELLTLKDEQLEMKELEMNEMKLNEAQVNEYLRHFAAMMDSPEEMMKIVVTMRKMR
ncbi:hypothetical protein PMAYCL1PPCAC_01652, partial [Pristionchus mayeri]